MPQKNSAGPAAMVAEEGGGQLSGHLGLAAWADAVGAARALESRQDVHVR
jgi:hypothetical protein